MRGLLAFVTGWCAIQMVSAQEGGGGLLSGVPGEKRDELARLARGVLGEKGGDRLFYLPTRDAPDRPTDWGCRYENVTFVSGDGTKLSGWFLKPKTSRPKGTIVFSHGNAGAMGYHLGFVVWLVDAGYQVFMYDYRGFGKSGGVLDRRGMVNDVKAAFAHVRTRPDVDANRLISFGHSLGGAKSLTAIGETPVKGLRAIVTDGAFASYQSMARVVAGQVGAGVVSDELSPKDYIAKVSPVPVLIVHGDKDEVVPVSEGKLLFSMAKEPKTLFEVEAGHHGDSLSRDSGAYRRRMLQWLEKRLGG